MIIQKLNFIQDQTSIHFRGRKQNPVSTAYHLQFPVSVRPYCTCEETEKKKKKSVIKRKNSQYKQILGPSICWNQQTKLGIFITALSVNRSSRQKISKDIEDLKEDYPPIHLTDSYRSFYSTVLYIFVLIAHEHRDKTIMLNHKISSINCKNLETDKMCVPMIKELNQKSATLRYLKILKCLKIKQICF